LETKSDQNSQPSPKGTLGHYNISFNSSILFWENGFNNSHYCAFWQIMKFYMFSVLAMAIFHDLILLIMALYTTHSSGKEVLP